MKRDNSKCSNISFQIQLSIQFIINIYTKNVGPCRNYHTYAFTSTKMYHVDWLYRKHQHFRWRFCI